MGSIEEVGFFIFDVNGVLIDANKANAQAMAEAFTDVSSLKRKIANHYLKLTGVDRGSKIRIIQEHVIKRPFEQNEFERRWEKFKNLAHHSMLNASLLTGCKEILSELGRSHATRAALSNTPLDELNEILEAHDLHPLLDLVRGGGDWPKSESLVRLVQESPFEPGRCLFFGDGKGDLAAARRAGVRFVAIDQDTGEFEGEQGFQGPYKNLADWGRQVLKIGRATP